MPASVDIVETAEQASDLQQPPLLVMTPLRRFLDELDLGTGPIEAQPLGDGHSNVTYLLTRSGTRLVLRRPPRPPYAQSAHNVVREAEIMMAATDAGLPVPRVLAICEDPQVLGVPFVLLEHVDGYAISSTLPASLCRRGEIDRIVAGLVETLAQIHAVDISTGPLAQIGRPTGYLDRQLQRFGRTWEQVRTRDVADMDRLASWLADHQPASTETTLVHGDYRLGNTLFTPGPQTALAAILDWEMATLGDPLADLGYLCATWGQAGELEHPMTRLSAATRTPGFPTRAVLARRYAELTGRDTSGLRWYQALALWKSAVFLEASYRRHLAGTTTDTYFTTLGQGVPLVAAAAMRLASPSTGRPL